MARTPKLTNAKERVIVRRAMIAEKYATGRSSYQIADILHLPQSTVSKDLRIMRRLAVTNVDTFINEKLPFEMDSMLNGTTQVLRKVFAILEDPEVNGRALWIAIDKILSVYGLRRQLLLDKLMMSSEINNALAEREYRELYPESQNPNPKPILMGPEGNPEAIF